MDKMRWRYGDTNPVVAAVDAATVIEIGDLLWQDTDDAQPASMVDGSGTAMVDDQRLFAEKFLGVAMQRSRYGDNSPIRVASTGVFEFDCISDRFELGDSIGVAFPRLGARVPPRLCSQAVEKVNQSKLAIGRVAKFEHEPTTTVLVDIRSAVMTGVV